MSFIPIIVENDDNDEDCPSRGKGTLLSNRPPVNLTTRQPDNLTTPKTPASFTAHSQYRPPQDRLCANDYKSIIDR